MEVFLVTGTNASAGRTTASLLLAFGLRLLGQETLHIQVIGGDERQPILQGDDAAPFEATWLRLNQLAPSAAAIQDCVSKFLRAEAVVVDLPMSAFSRVWIADPAFRILLPMATAPVDVERAARDFHEIADSFAPAGVVRPWLLPVGWPPAMQPSDFEPILDRATTREGLTAPPSDRVIQPPNVQGLDLKTCPIVVDGRMSLWPRAAAATERIAYATLKATDSSLLREPDDAF